MHKLEIKLKQHTPLIHFQHDQEGATLRASEVKPKLDRFILTRLGKGDYKAGVVQAKAKGWLVGKGEHPALDYKMRIEAKDLKIWDMRRQIGWNNRNGRPIFEQMPLFFGNMRNTTEKKMAFTSSPILLSFLSANNDIIDEINNYINDFFLLNNFGTRQSKGFGSFYPEGASIQNISDYAYFEWNFNNLQLGSWESFYNLFFAIEMFYKTLRSGINQQGVYFKSLMYHYAKDQEAYWDKRTIRYKFGHFNPNRNNDRGETRDNNTDGNNKEHIARLYRDMLGLSSAQQWGSYDDEITKEHIVEDDKNKIERFKSPLVFKPIIKGEKAIVYIFPTDIPEQYKGAEFRISSSQRHDSFIMKAPESFDIIDFLCYITDDGIKKWIIDQLEKMGTNRPIVKTLLVIYNKIKFVES